MVKDLISLANYLNEQAKIFGQGCEKVFVAVSGGIDSATVAAILCHAFGPENVIGMYRDIRSNPKHWEDAEMLKNALGFKLMFIDANPMYDEFLYQAKKQFAICGLPWVDENEPEADKSGFTSAYGSLKSRFTTPFAGFISKAIDSGKGRIFGTGNGEEDGILRYFDKFGDGAVDNNLLAGLTKAEVRQLARYLGVPEKLIVKKPSADLEANGDVHNDEDQLSKWAKDMGFDIRISYGAADGSAEGNVAWAWKEDLKHEVISATCGDGFLDRLGYSYEQKQVIKFLEKIERSTRHKVLNIPYVSRKTLFKMGFVD